MRHLCPWLPLPFLLREQSPKSALRKLAAVIKKLQVGDRSLLQQLSNVGCHIRIKHQPIHSICIGPVVWGDEMMPAPSSQAAFRPMSCYTCNMNAGNAIASFEVSARSFQRVESFSRLPYTSHSNEQDQDGTDVPTSWRQLTLGCACSSSSRSPQQ